MLIEILKSKLQDGYITHVRGDYDSSLWLDGDIMDEMELLENQVVVIEAIDFKATYRTNVVSAPSESKTISIGGAIAQHFQKGDRIHINVYCYMTEDEASEHEPKIVKTNIWTSNKK